MKRRKARGSKALNATAENIGAALGRVAARIDTWKRQRAEIADEVKSLSYAAQSMLAELGVTMRKNAGAARNVVRKAVKAQRKRRTMSAAARAKISAAQKKRWALRKRG